MDRVLSWRQELSIGIKGVHFWCNFSVKISSFWSYTKRIPVPSFHGPMESSSALCHGTQLNHVLVVLSIDLSVFQMHNYCKMFETIISRSIYLKNSYDFGNCARALWRQALLKYKLFLSYFLTHARVFISGRGLFLLNHQYFWQPCLVLKMIM